MRKFFAILLFVPIILVFFTGLTARTIERLFLEADTYKKLFVRHDIYGKIDELIAEELPKNGDDFLNGIPLITPEDASKILRATFPALFWQKTIEGIFDQFFAWFGNDADRLALTVSVKEPKIRLSGAFEKTVNERLAALPACAPLQILEMGKKFAENKEGQKIEITCKPSGVNEFKDIQKFVEAMIPESYRGNADLFKFIDDFLKTIPDNIDLVSLVYNLELQNLKKENNATAIPEVKLNENDQWDFLFKPQLEGGSPSFVKGLKNARGIFQSVQSYFIYLWIGLAAMLVIFILLIWGVLESILRWLGALFIAAGGVSLGIIYGAKQFAFLATTDLVLKNNDQFLNQFKPLFISIFRDITDQFFSPIKTASAIALLAGLFFILISVFTPHLKVVFNFDKQKKKKVL